MTDKSHTNKVTFFDEHLENVHFEYSALRRKLQSKVEALTIMSKELNSCRVERDQYKLMAEQVQLNASLKKITCNSNGANFSGNLDYDRNIVTSVKMLNDLREENKSLTIEVGRLKQRLSDRDGDIRILRQKLLSHKETDSASNNQAISFSNHDREELIVKMETLNEKIRHLKSDIRSMLDEKEEFISEREAYKCKIHRLNHELKVLMSGDKNNLDSLDVDSLIMENKFLTDRLAQIEAEKELANQGLLKYKTMLEHKKKKGISKLGTAESNQSVLSQEQVSRLLENELIADSSVSATTVNDLKSFFYGIIEALNDKTLALAHQRKANKILASRIADLEQRMNIGCYQDDNGTKFPSQILLRDYRPSDVDKEADLLLSEDDLKLAVKENETSPETRNGHDDRCNGFVEDLHRTSSNGVVKSVRTTNDVDSLPPNLEMLVRKAVDDIKNERASRSNDDNIK